MENRGYATQMEAGLSLGLITEEMREAAKKIS